MTYYSRSIAAVLCSAAFLLLVLYSGSPSHVSAEPQPGLRTVADMKSLLRDYEAEGAVNAVLASQLHYRLERLELLIGQSTASAIAEARDLAAYVQDAAVLQQQLLSEDASQAISAKADLICGLLGGTSDGVPVVAEGQPQAVVVVPDAANSGLLAAANELTQYVYQATSVQLPILTQSTPLPLDHIPIYIGAEAAPPDPIIADELEEMTGDGFLLYTRADAILIAGPTVQGTQNGVYGFLERYVGVRWLLPGPDGEDVPQLTELVVPIADVREEPTFMMRQFSLGSAAAIGPIHNQWAQRNRTGPSIRFHHNIHSLFPVSVYGASNPEFYPNGVPPAASAKTKWQPCYSEPGTIQAAVYGILDYFAANPDQLSFSLGVNDGGGYCEGNPSHPAYPDQLNSVGKQHLSDIYYAWVNAVVEQVLLHEPDKWFGLLAYQEVADPPSFPLHPRVVPFLTKDRMTWIDDGVLAVGESITLGWKARADSIGWYDYWYGLTYTLPRVFPRQMAETLRFGQDNGVNAVYAELYPNWGEGPKPWVAARLLWDPEQDVEALLTEWYERAVGPVAAPYLAAYFNHWEQFWTTRVQHSAWFGESKNLTYMHYHFGGYLELVSKEELRQSRVWLETAATLADTPAQQARAELLLRAFDYYEASAFSYPTREVYPASESEALQQLDDAVTSIVLGEERFDIYNQLKLDPVLKSLGDPTANVNGDLLWFGWNPYLFWNLAGYLAAEPPAGALAAAVEALETHAEPKVRQFAAALAEFAAAVPAPLNVNTSFESGTTTAPPWSFWIREGESIRRSTDTAYSGSASLRLQGIVRGGPTQNVAFFGPGYLNGKIRYYVPPGTDTAATIQLVFNIRNAAGAIIATLRNDEIALAESVGSWNELQIMEDIPASFNGVPAAGAQLVVTVDGMAPGEVLYLDDGEVYFIAP